MKKIILLGLLGIIVLIFFHFDLDQYLTLEYVKTQQQIIDRYYAENRVLALLGFFVLYVVVTGVSLPGATVLTLAGGAVFGLTTGLILISFASTIGASIAFLVSRYLFRDAVQNRFGASLKAINDGIDKDGPFYLFALRLVPAFPFFVINLVMGLTSCAYGHFSGSVSWACLPVPWSTSTPVRNWRRSNRPAVFSAVKFCCRFYCWQCCLLSVEKSSR